MARRRAVVSKHPGPGSTELRAYWRAYQAHFKPIDRAHWENGGGVEDHMAIGQEKDEWARRVGLRWMRGRGYELGHFHD